MLLLPSCSKMQEAGTSIVSYKTCFLIQPKLQCKKAIWKAHTNVYKLNRLLKKALLPLQNKTKQKPPLLSGDIQRYSTDIRIVYWSARMTPKKPILRAMQTFAGLPWIASDQILVPCKPSKKLQKPLLQWMYSFMTKEGLHTFPPPEGGEWERCEEDTLTQLEACNYARRYPRKVEHDLLGFSGGTWNLDTQRLGRCSA